MEILYSDRELAVCIKPVGLDSEHDVPQALKEQLGGQVFTVHRLDKNVGGVMVYARTAAAAAGLSREIQQGNFVKEYVAMAHGQPPAQGDWQDLLFKDSRRNKVFVVQRQRSGVKPARLEYVCQQAGERSLVRVRLHTGRSHQIRVQFASRGFPLVGDHKYGSRAKETEPMLFSSKIQFDFNGKTHSYEALPKWAEREV